MPGFASPGPTLADNLKQAEARVLKIAFALLGLILTITAVHVLTGFGGAALEDTIRDWLASAVYILVAGIVALRAVRERYQRGPWTLLAIGISLYGLGNLLWASWLAYTKDPPIPSICDALWLALYPLSYAGIVGLARMRDERRAVTTRLWLDGVIAGSGLAAIGAALVFKPVLDASTGGPIAVATELAYPVCDLMLAALILGVLAIRGWRLDRSWAFLTGGFLALATADCMYAVKVASGSTNTTSQANLFFMLGVTLLAAGAWQAGGGSEPTARRARWLVLVLPAGFTLGSLGLLVYDHFHRLDPLALSLAIVTVLAAILRLALAFRDVSSLAEARHQASTDDLTAMPNRRTFVERTRSAMRVAELTGARLAVLILDLDNFKELNETLGHDAGDELLQKIGPRLRRVLRSTDAVARLGGDEFGVLLGELDHHEAAGRVAEKLLRALSEPFPVQGLRLRLTASIGIASCPDHRTDAAELLRRAEVAMYLAKAGPRSVEHYAPDRDTNSRERLMLAGELASAIEHGGIVALFQAKAAARTRQIVGAEALVRWRRPDGTLLLPGQFLPAAEQAGLSRALTRVILTAALDQLQIWRDHGWDIHVAVNTTVADLLDESFPEEVAAELRARDLPPDSLVLEVTESSVLSDPVRIGDVLARLGEHGIELSLDDFGTGYSSLSHLRSFPVREVKMDRSFVSWMCIDDTDSAIVFAMIQLAHKLGMRVVAEGVEDGETWRVLEELGCELIQGHALSRPVTADELESQLNRSAQGTL